MTRDLMKLRRSMVVVLLAVFFGGVSITTASHAGDSDGVLGYSMRLKNKDFTNEGGSGGGNLLVVIPDDVKSPANEPQMNASPFPFFVGARVVLREFWPWMILRVW
jgi:hypothetical protein